MDAAEADDVAATFALGSVVEPPTLVARGATGFIWKVTTDRGSFAVKRLQSWVTPDPMPFDVHVQHAAEGVGIPLPRPVLTPGGEAMVEHTRVYEWVDLLPAHPTPAAPAVATEVGDLLGRLHRLALPPADPGVDRWYLDPPTVDDWRDVLRRGTDGGMPWTSWLADEIDFLDDVGRRVGTPYDGPEITCHRDFAPGNLLPSAADGSLVVLDWENAGALPAVVELAWTVVFWCASRDRVDEDAALALVEAYGESEPLVPSAFHGAVVTHLNFLKVNLDASLDDPSDFADRWIDDLQPANLRQRLSGIDRLAALFGPR